MTIKEYYFQYFVPGNIGNRKFDDRRRAVEYKI